MIKIYNVSKSLLKIIKLIMMILLILTNVNLKKKKNYPSLILSLYTLKYNSIFIRIKNNNFGFFFLFILKT